MAKLEVFAPLGRWIRKDQPIGELGNSTFDLLKAAIERGDSKQALALLEYLRWEGKGLHDIYCDWTYTDLDYIARNYGEDEIPKLLRYAKEKLDQAAPLKHAATTAEDLVAWFAEIMRAHRCGPGERGVIGVREERDRYVLEFDPCGSGGRMRRGGELDGTPPRTGPPLSLGRTSKPYPWSWSKAGVPYYCVHCCIWHEIMPMEQRGYPVRITDYNDDPHAPCRWYVYKSPQAIPEEFYLRVGQQKPARFKPGTRGRRLVSGS